MSLLDVGCGPGTITVDLAPCVAPGPVTGIDASATVIAEAQANAAGSGVEFAVGDLYALGFDDGRFDVVHAHQVLQHVPDPVGALREMRRVCAPDGIVAARDSDYAAFTWFPEVPELDEWLALYRRIARRNGGEPDAGRRLASWARSAGFAEVQVSASVWCFATPADRQWWGGMWSDRITSSAIAEQAVTDGDATVGDLARLSAAWRAWAADDDGWFAILHGEIVCRPGT
jgi:SAM-dependent methyltransferase